MRRLPLATLLLLCLLAVLGLRGSHPGHGTASGDVVERPPIVCVSGRQYTRCPSDCEAGPRGEAHCRCQDFYLRRNGQALQYSHQLCR